jgi:ribosomal protein S18 acetylase RimI-like enzyme
MRFKFAPKEQWVLRHARKGDSRHIAELIVIGGDERPCFPYVPERENIGPIELSRPRAARRDENFAIRHATLAMVSSHVAGMLLGYKLTPKCEPLRSDWLSQCLRPIIEPGPDLMGSFYINTLAIYPAYQNHGMGSRFLEKANHKAVKMGCSAISLEVAEQNEDAVRFYRRHGFLAAGRRPSPHDVEPYNLDIAFFWRPVNR